MAFYDLMKYINQLNQDNIVKYSFTKKKYNYKLKHRANALIIKKLFFILKKTTRLIKIPALSYYYNSSNFQQIYFIQLKDMRVQEEA